MVDKRLFIEQLFRQNYNEMFRLARTLLGDAEEADDVVQDVFLKIAKSEIQPEDCVSAVISLRLSAMPV